MWGSNFWLSHKKKKSPLTQGLNYRSACNFFITHDLYLNIYKKLQAIHLMLYKHWCKTANTVLKKTKSINLKFLSSIITALFISIIYFNMIGILPYIFSISNHVIVTLSLSLPVWLILILRKLIYSPKKQLVIFYLIAHPHD